MSILGCFTGVTCKYIDGVCRYMFEFKTRNFHRTHVMTPSQADSLSRLYRLGLHEKFFCLFCPDFLFGPKVAGSNQRSSILWLLPYCVLSINETDGSASMRSEAFSG